MKIAILGNPGIGKSALTLRFIKKGFVNYYEPTIEEEFEKRMQIWNHSVDVFILDTAGQEEFMPLRSRWITSKDAFIIAASVEDFRAEEFEK